jgi:hypothetical protein
MRSSFFKGHMACKMTIMKVALLAFKGLLAMASGASVPNILFFFKLCL